MNYMNELESLQGKEVKTNIEPVRDFFTVTDSPAEHDFWEIAY
jgi:hypothetical protein